MTEDQQKDFDRYYKCPKTNKFNYKMPLGVTNREKRCDYMTITTETNPKADLVKVFLNKRPLQPYCT